MTRYSPLSPPWCYPPSPLFSFFPTSTTASFPFLLSSPLHFQPATMLSSIFICRHFKDSMKQLCKLFLDTSDLMVSINSCNLSYSLILRLIETWNGNRFVQSCIFRSSVTLWPWYLSLPSSAKPWGPQVFILWPSLSSPAAVVVKCVLVASPGFVKVSLQLWISPLCHVWDDGFLSCL